MYTLISATPSPYARKVRIALAEKGIPFELQTEVPWDATTQTPQYNPLEKLPVLIVGDNDNGNNHHGSAGGGAGGEGRHDHQNPKAVYESHFILEWLEAKHPDPPLLPAELDDRLFAKQVEVVCDGVCDALVLCFFEKMRGEGRESGPWKDRQMRKVDGGLQALATWVEGSDGEFLIGDRLTLADVAAGSLLGYMSVRWPDHHWKQTHPQLVKYWEGLDARESFATTRPYPQNIQDRIV